MTAKNRNSICILIAGKRAVEMYYLTGETVGEFVHRISRPLLRGELAGEEFQLSRTNRRYRLGRHGEEGASEVNEDCILQSGDTLCSHGYVGYSIGFDAAYDADSEFYITCQEADLASCHTCNKRKSQVYGEPK